MDTLIAALVAALLGLAVGGATAWLVARARAAREHAEAATATSLSEHELDAARLSIDALRAERDELVEAQRTLQVSRESLSREHAALEATVDGLRQQLASTRDEQSKAAERDREEQKVLQQLAPVREAVTRLQTQLVDLERQRSEQHGSITQQLRSSLQSEERLRQTAESLASALSSNSTRGVWGETQLRRVVEAAGLIERVSFDTQTTFTKDERRLRPDMVVHLPGGKHLALDAKVPFDAYLEASRIPATASDEELARRTTLLQQHVKALRSHVDALASKQYWTGIANSPELVVAFIPSESLVSAALEADPSIMEYAFGKGVALASPVTLWSLLKSVAISWSQAAVAEDAMEVHELSQVLYERIATLAGHADRLRGSLEGAVKHFNAFSSSLETRVLVTARKMSRLDAPKPISDPGEIEAAPKPLTAVEFTDMGDDALESEAERGHADLAIDALARREAQHGHAADDEAASA